MLSRYLSTLSSKGQITLPKEVREKLQLDSGQLVIMKIEGNELILQKGALKSEAEEFSEEEWETLREIALEKGKSYSTGKSFLKSLQVNKKRKSPPSK